MRDLAQLLERWQLDISDVRERMYRAPTSRERERWHALWLLAQGWTTLAVSEALEREPHTIGAWVAAFSDNGPTALAFVQSGGSPPPSTGASRPN
ncbi:MAG: helix-turn-helix domain-containing protein [Chloroflexi bacterium]|nr:helix-turn-helix domain-containing protein [Chloroflexota bacterium]